MKNKKRLDVLLTEQMYADSRSRTQAIIMVGLVYVNGQKADKPGVSYDADTAVIEVRGQSCPYVSRGGPKLEKALRDFGVKPEGYVCSDSGASTGGFTDCLLKQGTAKVFAIDVGFISLSIVLPAIKNLLKEGNGQVLCLIKPQFEAGKEKVGMKGVVRYPETHEEVLDGFVALAHSLNFTILGLTFSPVKGPEGNIEFLGHLTLAEMPGIEPDTNHVVAQAHNTLKG